MKTFGVLLLTGLLATNLVLADETTVDKDVNLTLAARAPQEASWTPAQTRETPEVKVTDIDLNDQLKGQLQTLTNSIGDRLEVKLNEKMQKEMALDF
ncbi:MAG TPA: hypothetical protein VIC08_15435 [Cellvibrionaceae bacterium]